MAVVQETRAFASPLDVLMARLVYARNRWFGYPIRILLYFLGIDMPEQVPVGPGLVLLHGPCGGVVVHWNTTIGANVTLMQGVTIGRADPWVPIDDDASHSEVVIGDDVVLCAGAVVVAKSGHTVTVGAGTIVGANAVLLVSTGQREVWAGNPARKVADR